MFAIPDHIYNQIAYGFYMILVISCWVKEKKLLEFASCFFGWNKYQHFNKKESKSSKI